MCILLLHSYDVLFHDHPPSNYVNLHLANFGTNTHKPELYLLLFSHFLFTMEFAK